MSSISAMTKTHKLRLNSKLIADTMADRLWVGALYSEKHPLDKDLSHVTMRYSIFCTVLCFPHFRMMENAEHTLVGSYRRVSNALASFWLSIVNVRRVGCQ